MGKLSIIEIDEEQKWDDIVTSFKNYDINYLNSYAKAFQLCGNSEPKLVYYEHEDTKAVKIVMRRDIAKSQLFKGKLEESSWFDLITPYGYGGFWIEGNDYEDVEKTYNDRCEEEGFISEFVRFNLFSDCRKFYGGIVESPSRNVVRSLELPLEEILMDCDRTVRTNIRKAQRSNLTFEVDTEGTRLDEFLEIYYQTMDRKRANSEYFFPKEFFEILNEMEDHFAYFYVLHEGKVISTELNLYGEENCYSFLGGTNKEYFPLRPNEFLKCEIIKWAKEKGLKRIVLGGGYGSDDGLFRYKKCLAPNGVVDFYVGKKIFNEEKYSKLLDIRKKDSNFDEDTTFFPKYRG